MDPEIPRAKFLLVPAQFLTRILAPPWPELVFIQTLYSLDLYLVTISDSTEISLIICLMMTNREIRVRCPVLDRKGAAVAGESWWLTVTELRRSWPCLVEAEAGSRGHDTVNTAPVPVAALTHPQWTGFLPKFVNKTSYKWFLCNFQKKIQPWRMRKR